MDWLGAVATFVAVFLAFQLENWRFGKQAKEEKKREKQYLNDLLLRIKTAISENAKKLNNLKEVIGQGENNVKVAFPNNLSTWDELNPEIIKYLRNLTLLDDLSDYFMKFRIVCDLQDRYFNGVVQSYTSTPEQQKILSQIIGSIKKNIEDFSDELLSKSQKLQQDIQLEINK